MKRNTFLLSFGLFAFGAWRGLAAHPANQPYGAPLPNSHPESEYGPAIPFYKVPSSKGSLALEKVGNRLYALEDGGLSVYDISIPKQPKRLGFVGGMGNVRQLAVRGKTAFVTSRQCGLWAVDLSEDAQPKILSNFDAVEMSTGLDVVGDVAFIGNRVYGVQCVDVSDPREMKHLSSFQTDESQSVYYGNGYLYSGDWAGGEVTVIDVSDTQEPKAVSRIHLDGYGDGMAMRGNILFASTGQHRKSGPEEDRHGAGHGLDIFDVADPKQPKKLSSIKFPKYYFGPCDYWTPRLAGPYCYASDTINGLFLVDIRNLRKPKIVGNLVLPKRDPEDASKKVPFAQIMDPAIPQGDPIASIAVGEGVIYIAGNYTGIYWADLPQEAVSEERSVPAVSLVPNPRKERIQKGFWSSGAELSNPTRAVAIRGDIAYTANVWDGIKIYLLSEQGPKLIGRHPVRYVADVKRSGDRLYVAEGMDGIGVYQIANDTQLNEIGRLPVLEKGLNFAQHLWAFDGHDVVAATTAHSVLHLVDFSDPKSPKILSSEKGVGLIYGPYGAQSLVQNRFFTLPRHCGGWMIFEINGAESKLWHHDTFPMCSQTGGATAVDDQILVMRAGGYALIDPYKIPPVQQMERHLFAGQTELPKDVPDDSAISRAMFPKGEREGYVHYDAESGKMAVVNRMMRRYYIYAKEGKRGWKILKEGSLIDNAYPPNFWKGRLILPGAYSGLLLEKVD